MLKVIENTEIAHVPVSFQLVSRIGTDMLVDVEGIVLDGGEMVDRYFYNAILSSQELQELEEECEANRQRLYGFNRTLSLVHSVPLTFEERARLFIERMKKSAAEDRKYRNQRATER